MRTGYSGAQADGKDLCVGWNESFLVDTQGKARLRARARNGRVRIIMKKFAIIVPVGLAISSLLGCAPQASVVRMGAPRPERDEHCDLTVIDTMDMTKLADYEQVGVINVSNAEKGKSALDPDMRALVRPRACALGGDAISVLASGDVTNQSGLHTTAYGGYIVWAKKSTKPATPQQF